MAKIFDTRQTGWSSGSEIGYRNLPTNPSLYHEEQLDIPYNDFQFFTLPTSLPGRVTAEDMIFFNWPESMDPSPYTVVVPSLDTSGPSFRSIGQLRETMQLPLVHFDWGKEVLVLPNIDSLPKFVGIFSRSMTYTLPKARGSGYYEMQRTGVAITGI